MSISFLTSRELLVIRSFYVIQKDLLWSKSKTWNELKFGIWTFFCQWPHSTRAEMTCIPLNKTWQMNILWLMDPPVPEQRCHDYQYTKLGRWTYFGQWTPSTREEMHWKPVHTTWQMNLLWLMDPPCTRADMPWIPVHNTLQMNWLCPMDPPR